MIQVRTENAKLVPPTNKYRGVLHLREERAFREGMPPVQENTNSMEEAVQGSGSYIRRRSHQGRSNGETRAVGK